MLHHLPLQGNREMWHTERENSAKWESQAPLQFWSRGIVMGPHSLAGDYPLLLTLADMHNICKWRRQWSWALQKNKQLLTWVAHHSWNFSNFEVITAVKYQISRNYLGSKGISSWSSGCAGAVSVMLNAAKDLYGRSNLAFHQICPRCWMYFCIMLNVFVRKMLNV